MTLGLTGFLLIGLRFWRGVVLAVAAFQLIGFVLMAVVPDSVILFEGDPQQHVDDVAVGATVCGINGTTFGVLLAAAIGYLGVRGWSRSAHSTALE